MANEQYAFLNKDRLPTRETWQSAIDSTSFSLQLDPEMNVGDDIGFLSCVLYGAELGVEIEYTEDEEFIEQFADIAPGKNYCIAFRWGGSEIECAIAMILSYALAKDFDAVVSYEGEPPSGLEQLHSETQEILDDSGILG